MCEKDFESGEQRDGQENIIQQNQEEPDLLPEFCRYRDEGCELAGSCLGCPLPCCVYDKPGGSRRALKKLRDREIARLFRSEGKSVKGLAKKFRVSIRTVRRALAEKNTKSETKSNYQSTNA